MIFALGYSIISTGVFYLVYLVVSKKWNSLTIKKPFIVSAINLFLAILVISLYLFNPASFSSNATIDNKAAYILFTVFATYFYYLMIPLSGLQIIVILKNKLYNKSFRKYIIGMNLLTIATIVYLTANIF